MSNREKIIVALAAVALLYGVYIVFLEPKPGEQQFATKTTPKADLDQLNIFITKIATATKEGLSEKDSYILQRAENQWIRDPLIRIRKPKESEKESQKTAKMAHPDFAIQYTGFLEMGTMRLAIINGNEYAAGDRMEQGGYIVRSISPTQIVVAADDGSRNLFIVPLQETQ
jgi:hypothetical protein